MKNVVVDANIFISTLISFPTNLRILRPFRYNLYAPSKLIEEIRNNKIMICEKARCEPRDFDNNFNAVLKLVRIIEYTEYKKYLERAAQALGPEHPADAHYLACALHVKALFIWTNDKDFSRQAIMPAKNTKQVFIRIKIFKYLDYWISRGIRER